MAHTCSKCQKNFETDEGRQKSSNVFLCKSCDRLSSYVAKLGDVPAKFKSMEPSEMMSFYRSAEKMRTSDGKFSFDRVKGEMEVLLLNKLTREEGETEESPYRPLSVWAAQGYDVEKIRANGTKRDHDQLGETYSVRLETEYGKSSREMVQQQCAKLCLRPRKKQRADPELQLQILEDLEAEDEQAEENPTLDREARALERQKLKARRAEALTLNKLATRVVTTVAGLLAGSKVVETPALSELRSMRAKALQYLQDNQAQTLDFSAQDFDGTVKVHKEARKPKAKAKSKSKAPKEAGKEGEGKD